MDRQILILGALREEINLIRRRMTVKRQFKAGHADVWSGNWEGASIVLARTGMGKNCALSAFDEILKTVRPSLVLSLGYAGGLGFKLKIGDLIIPDSIIELSSNNSYVNKHAVSQQQLVLLEKLNFPTNILVHRGALITVNQVICDPVVKKELGSLYNALAVDMETSALIAHATKNKIPFISIRSISDTVEQSLVDMSSFISNDGEVSKIKAGWYIARHPNMVKKFISFRDQSQKATSNMTEFAGVIVRSFDCI
jgi:adenosylhomocysteine nucleosidase